MDTTPVHPLVVEANVIEAMQTVFDPEIPVNIWEIGLIYGIAVDPSGAVGVRMTLTSPNCPSAAELPQEVERKVKAIVGVTAATVEVVFEPPWEPAMMSEAAIEPDERWPISVSAAASAHREGLARVLSTQP